MNPMSYKSTIAGAFSALGTTLMGVGIVPQLNGLSSKPLTYIALAGFMCSAIGTFLGHLLSADASALRGVQADVVKVDQKADQIVSTLKGDTTMFPNPTPVAPAPVPPQASITMKP